jgi:hypothetical protein
VTTARKAAANFFTGALFGGAAILAAVLLSAFVIGWGDVIAHGFCKPESYVGIGGCEGFAESKGLDDAADDVPVIVDWDQGGLIVLPAYLVAVLVAAILDARGSRAGFWVWAGATGLVVVVVLVDVIEGGAAL